MEGSKYPPTGTRGYGPLYAAHSVPGLPQAGPSYDDHADNELLVMVQIESQQGLENVEAIAKTDGIDVLLIGKFHSVEIVESRAIRIPATHQF